MPGLLAAIEIETGKNPTASIIWLHGLGADGNDFAPIVPELRLPDTAIRFVFPHAPVRPVTINRGMRMRAWYDITDGADRREDERGVRASQVLLEALIGRDKERWTADAGTCNRRALPWNGGDTACATRSARRSSPRSASGWERCSAPEPKELEELRHYSSRIICRQRIRS